VHFLCFYNSPACREINARLAFLITVKQLGTTRESKQSEVHLWSPSFLSTQSSNATLCR